MKGFGNVSQQKLLVKGWLIPENRKYYRFKTKNIMMESLPMMLNMWIALATDRYESSKASDETRLNALTLIGCLDKDLTNKSYEDKQAWMESMMRSDRFYVDYHQKLVALVKNKIFSGQHGELNGAITVTWEYKQWMLEAGHTVSTVNLIDGWIHPLSESKDGFANMWMVASMLLGIATGRHNEGDKSKCIGHLIKLGVLDPQSNFQMQIEVAQLLDSEYLKLVNQTKEALEKAEGLPQ